MRKKEEPQKPIEHLSAKEAAKQMKILEAEENFRRECEEKGLKWEKEKKKLNKISRKAEKAELKAAKRRQKQEAKAMRRKKRKLFVREVKAVRWPTVKETGKNCAAVLGVTAVCTLFVWGVDIFCSSVWSILSVWGGF